MDESAQAVTPLRRVIAKLRPADERPPRAIDDFWEDLARWTLEGWVAGIERDMRRAERAIEAAGQASGPPDDDHVAALEESLWRLTAGTEKLDTLISLAFGAKPLVVANEQSTAVTMRPSRDRNNKRLRAIGSPAALRLVEARAALAGERARLRRHQIMHSLPPLAQLEDLAPFIRVHHRDGRIFGYELVRWAPERWDEGIDRLAPETLFARRLYEARRGLEALVIAVSALAQALEDDPILRLPQFVYYDHDSRTYAIEPPASTGPPRSFEIDFVLDATDPPVSRRVSSPSKIAPGEEITFDDGIWRVIRVAESESGADKQLSVVWSVVPRSVYSRSQGTRNVALQ